MKNIIVMGGSFNPPTLAHYKLMKDAIDALDARKGYFVPVSDAYLKRKMRHANPPVVLPPDMRIRMLDSMCTDERMEVCDFEIGTIEARTMTTLTELQKLHTDDDIYFLLGADKLSLLIHLAENREFLDKFKVVLYSREHENLEERLKADEVLSKYLDRIVILPQPKGTDSISSSLVRERMLNCESGQEMLCAGVWEIFKNLKASDYPDVIDRFKGKYDFLSNRFVCTFTWEGLNYTNAEAAFQASKIKDEKGRKRFYNCSADRAANNGKEIIPYDSWKENSISIMESILEAKFVQNPSLMKKLRATANCVLLYGNNKKDTYWGYDLYSCQGENILGEILMKIRDTVK